MQRGVVEELSFLSGEVARIVVLFRIKSFCHVLNCKITEIRIIQKEMRNTNAVTKGEAPEEHSHGHPSKEVCPAHNKRK